jgi:hypothetical protein
MDLGATISELKKEAERISRAIAALTGLGGRASMRKRKTGASRKAKANSKKRRRMTAAGRKRLSMLMKKRWAERKRKDSRSL